MTINKWLMAVDKAKSNTIDKVPEGWITRSQFEDMTGYKTTHAGRKLSIMKKAGLVETKRFRIMTAGRSVYPEIHYKIK